MVDLLANISLRLDDITFVGISKIEVQTRPSILDNFENWQVFDDDLDILRFLHYDANFGDREINFAKYVKTSNNEDTFLGK